MRTIANDDDKSFINQPRASQAERQEQVRKLIALGPRPVLEFLREIDHGADVWKRLEVYASLPRDFLRANGADQFLPDLFAIAGDRQ